MHFLCFRPEGFQTGQGCHKGISLSPNYLENSNCLFLPSVPIFLPERVNDLPKAGVFLIWRRGDWGEGSPHSSLFCCYLVPHNPCTVHFTTTLHLSPPMHLDLSPPYLSGSQMGLDCLIREGRHRVISGQTAPSCCQARDLCPTLGPLSTSFSLPALDSRKGRGKFCLQGSVIC